MKARNWSDNLRRMTRNFSNNILTTVAGQWIVHIDSTWNLSKRLVYINEWELFAYTGINFVSLVTKATMYTYTLKSARLTLKKKGSLQFHCSFFIILIEFDYWRFLHSSFHDSSIWPRRHDFPKQGSWASILFVQIHKTFTSRGTDVWWKMQKHNESQQNFHGNSF